MNAMGGINKENNKFMNVGGVAGLNQNNYGY